MRKKRQANGRPGQGSEVPKAHVVNRVNLSSIKHRDSSRHRRPHELTQHDAVRGTPETTRIDSVASPITCTCSHAHRLNRARQLHVVSLNRIVPACRPRRGVHRPPLSRFSGGTTKGGDTAAMLRGVATSFTTPSTRSRSSLLDTPECRFQCLCARKDSLSIQNITDVHPRDVINLRSVLHFPWCRLPKIEPPPRKKKRRAQGGRFWGCYLCCDGSPLEPELQSIERGGAAAVSTVSVRACVWVLLCCQTSALVAPVYSLHRVHVLHFLGS